MTVHVPGHDCPHCHDNRNQPDRCNHCGHAPRQQGHHPACPHTTTRRPR